MSILNKRIKKISERHRQEISEINASQELKEYRKTQKKTDLLIDDLSFKIEYFFKNTLLNDKFDNNFNYLKNYINMRLREFKKSLNSKNMYIFFILENKINGELKKIKKTNKIWFCWFLTI